MSSYLGKKIIIDIKYYLVFLITAKSNNINKLQSSITHFNKHSLSV